MKIRIIEKDVVRAIDWAASEYKFIIELKEELALIEKEQDISQRIRNYINV